MSATHKLRSTTETRELLDDGTTRVVVRVTCSCSHVDELIAPKRADITAARAAHIESVER